MPATSVTLSALAKHINAELHGNGEQTITGIAPLSVATNGQISFLHSPRYRSYLGLTKASAVILSAADQALCQTDTLLVADPYLAFAKAATLFAYHPTNPVGIHPTAVVGENCQIDASASIGPGCVIGKRVVIDPNVVLHPGCIIGDDVSIGTGTQLWARVTLYYGVKIGSQIILHSGVVIGSDGFGLARENNHWYKIPQIGSVVIHNDVEIGANTTIDRGALGDTVIEEGVKLDNQIQIAHNVKIGAHTAIAANVSIAGSTEIGRHCMIGGGGCVGGHLKIVDQVVLLGMAMITNSIAEPGVYGSGTGFQKQRDWRKSAVRFQQLDQLARRLKKLEETVNKL